MKGQVAVELDGVGGGGMGEGGGVMGFVCMGYWGGEGGGCRDFKFFKRRAGLGRGRGVGSSTYA